MAAVVVVAETTVDTGQHLHMIDNVGSGCSGTDRHSVGFHGNFAALEVVA